MVGLLSTCVQSVGLTLQRKSHMLEDEKEDHIPRRAPYRRRRWQIGMLLFLLSNIIGSSIQITTLPLPLLSTLQASGLVFNALMATLLLKEPFTLRTTVGTVLVAAGAVLISSFSAVPEPSHNLDQLLQLLVVPNFIIWMSMTLVLVLAFLVCTFCLNHLLAAPKKDRPRMRLIKGMCYGLISGVLSAHALLLAKSAVELLVRTIVDHKNQFDRYQSWLLLLFFLFLALTQLYYLHLGLKLVTTSVLYPFVFCVYNIIAILDGLIYFRQTDRLRPLHAALIAVGTAILLVGVLALSWRLSEDEPEAGTGAHIRPDIPHSALAPGMGFVEDQIPDHSGGDDEDPETAPLIRRRHTLRDSALLVGQKRRRRSNLHEWEAIWDELDDEERYYGTLPKTSSQLHLLSQDPRDSMSDDRDTDLPKMYAGVSRAKTMPVKKDNLRPHSENLHLRGEQRPKRDSLTRNLRDWWKSRWKDQDDQRGGDDSGGGGGGI